MQRDPLACVRARFERYGDMYYASVLGRDVYAMGAPELVHEVLVNQATKFEKPREGLTADQLRRLLGDGLLTSNGELWRRQRRAIQPAFRKERLADYADLIVEYTQAMLDGFQDGEELDVDRAMMDLTLRVVSKTLFDHDVTSETCRVAQAMRVFRGAFGGVDAVLPDWLVTPARRRTLEALSGMNDIVYGLIEQRRGASGHDLLSRLSAEIGADDGRGMETRQLRDELLTLFIAGHETTAHALSWTLHLLSTHPEVSERLQRDIDAVLGTRSPSLSALCRLPYLEQVFLESLRLFPPAYVLARVVVEEAEVAGYVIPKGANVVLWIYHVHHHPRVFEDPERFDPERFSAQRRREIPPSAHIPFGAGTRSCIGKQFAMMEAGLILLSILQRFRLQPRAGRHVERDTAMTLAPRGGLPLLLRERTTEAMHVLPVRPEEAVAPPA